MKNCPTCHLTYPNEFTLCPHDGGTLETKAEWSTGTVVREKYRILGPIGAGGMATVYKAEHIHFREVRALKVISSSLSGDDGFVRRFMQEAVLTRRLQHPNAVRVDDIDRGEDGRPFIVMEFIDGISLRDAMKPQVPMNVERACRIAKQVASALGAAHALGMVHRDIKPANIFLANTYSASTRAADGEQAKVLDFGIAKVKESQLEDTRLRNLTMTGAGMVIGTPSYMSPEQAAGKRGDDLDGRSDLYSLGVVLYQMLSGDLPLYAESDLQLLMAHLVVEPVPLQQRVPGVPPLLAYLVMRCLAKEPSMRPADAHAFVAEIEEFEKSLSTGPVPLAPVAQPVLRAVVALENKTPPPPTRSQYQVDYATVDPKKKVPFFGTTKALGLVAMLLFALGLMAFGVISHFRKQAVATITPPVVTPPVITSANKTPANAAPPSTAVPTLGDATPADNPGDAQPQKSTDESAADSFNAPIAPPAVKTPPVKSLGSKTASAKDYPPVGASSQTSSAFPDPGQKQMPSETSAPSGQGKANDPWSSYAGNSGAATSGNAGGGYPATGSSAAAGNNPAASNLGGGYPALNNPSAANQQSGNAGGGYPSLGNPSNPTNGMPGGMNRPGAGDVLNPAVISKVEPKYSQEAKSFRYSGTSILSIVVDEHGLPGDIRVLRAAGYGLDKQAVEAVSKWHFSPGLRNGMAVRSRVGIQVNFRYAGFLSFARSSLFFQ